MHVETEGCQHPFDYAADVAEDIAKGLQVLGVAREVAYGLLVADVVEANLDCDVEPKQLAYDAIRGVCETVIAQAYGEAK